MGLQLRGRAVSQVCQRGAHDLHLIVHVARFLWRTEGKQTVLGTPQVVRIVVASKLSSDLQNSGYQYFITEPISFLTQALIEPGIMHVIVPPSNDRTKQHSSGSISCTIMKHQRLGSHYKHQFDSIMGLFGEDVVSK